MAQTLLKLYDVGKHNCTGIYFVDERGSYEGYDKLSGSLVPTKLPYDYKLILRARKGRKVHKKTFSFKQIVTLNQAVKQVVEQKDKVFESKKKSTTVPTLNEYWKEYVEHKKFTVNKKENWRESTAKDMENFYIKWIEKAALGKMLITEVEQEDVEKIISKIQKTRALRTSKKVVEALSPLFKRYYKNNSIQRLNPAQIEIGALNNEREVEYSIEMVKSLYKAMYSFPIERYRNVFIWLSTGRRVNEVLSLTYANIDLEKNLVNIHQDNSKSGKKLTFVLREKMLDAFKEGHEPSDILHISEKGKKLLASTVRKHWLELLKSIGLKDIHMHDIRHFLGSILRDGGVPEDLRALVLGHSKTSITARYASQNAKLADEVFDFFINRINGSKKKWSDDED